MQHGGLFLNSFFFLGELVISRSHLFIISMLAVCILIAFLIVGFSLRNEKIEFVPKYLVTETNMGELHKEIDELVGHLKENPKDGIMLKRLGSLYVKAGLLKKAVSAYVSAARELPEDKEIKRAFIDLNARGHFSGN